MHQWIVVAIFVICGLRGADSLAYDRSAGRLLDALSVGDRVVVRTQGRNLPQGSAWIMIVSEDHIGGLIPTPEERQEYESLKVDDAAPPLPAVGGTEEQRREYAEKNTEWRKRMARRAELSLKTAAEAGWVTAVGEDFVAIKADEGPVSRWPLHQIARITERADGRSVETAPRSTSNEKPSSLPASKLLDALKAGEEVVLQQPTASLSVGTVLSTGPITVFVGMQDDLKDRVAPAEERREYAQLLEAESIDVPTAVRGGREALEDLRRRSEERRARQDRLRVLKSKAEYEMVRLTAVGDDFIAFDSEGATAYVPTHRIGLILVKPPSATAPPPKAD